MTKRLGPHYFFDKMGKRFQKKNSDWRENFCPSNWVVRTRRVEETENNTIYIRKKKGCDLP